MSKKAQKLLFVLFPALVLSACSSTNGFVNSKERELENKVETSLNTSIVGVQKMLEELNATSKGLKVESKVVANAPINKTVANKDENKKVIVAKDGTQIDKVEKIKVATKGVDPQSSKGKEIALSTLDQKINLNWNGEASNLISSLSRKIGFKYTETGTKKPMKVNVSAKNKTIKEVLGLIDSQTKEQADIKISSANKTIQVSYK